MKLFNYKKDGQIRLGLKINGISIDLVKEAKNLDFDIEEDMISFIKGYNKKDWNELLKRIELNKKSLNFLNEEKIEFAPVVLNPEKIICVGLNYKEHIEESESFNLPKEPVLFSKFNNSLCACNEDIPLPRYGKELDYEAELVIVIGKDGKNIDEYSAYKHIFGYTVGNDLSIRDLQFLSNQWLIGKTADKFAPIGPYIVEKDYINPNNLNISTKVNGEFKQNSNTKYMIFKPEEIVSYVSRNISLKAGDLIFTGTPKGCVLGYPKDERNWLKKGDVVEIEIENIGRLINKLV
ncbi:fumarylacetoacetate hydrolase family protein [Peptoniphilus catoniae]|uniref:fumarylacetoacetate hydrolase family protein n=1 Tax=Peptoniphilus catoniae TaxID=1660341 RepID=UPI0010FE61F5|nr:fumarylacetoacetate hydrolase family protein [Peptoniphilus catoniae]